MLKILHPKVIELQRSFSVTTVVNFYFNDN